MFKIPHCFFSFFPFSILIYVETILKLLVFLKQTDYLTFQSPFSWFPLHERIESWSSGSWSSGILSDIFEDTEFGNDSTGILRNQNPVLSLLHRWVSDLEQCCSNFNLYANDTEELVKTQNLIQYLWGWAECLHF